MRKALVLVAAVVALAVMARPAQAAAPVTGSHARR
jgi:hypothetical protein